MMGRAVRDSFAKLDPRVQIQTRSCSWCGFPRHDLRPGRRSVFGVQDAGVPTYYVVAIAVILWLTDLFSNFAEALAEGRGKAQADSLRAAKKDVEAHRIESVEDKEHFTVVPGAELTRGDLVVVHAGEQIPGDGDVIEGAASVDESAITGESALWSARPAATALPLPAVPRCCPTGSSSRSPASPARASWTR